MAKINGTNVAAAIVPFTTEDQFATHEAKYGKGGWKEVTTIAERDAISSARREAGMAVRVVSENKTYILKQDLTTWDELVDTSEIEQEIEDIKAVIPAQASAENKLADKNFVNSSVATNTAYFIGTFNSVEELEAYSGTLTNNDYAFVKTVDAAGNTLYDRYKYNADTQQWMFEYELNNSSFTADQWAAINSGATPEAIAQIDTNTDDIANLQTNKQDKLTAGEHITIDANNVISAEGGLPDGEPLSLYGTNEDGEPEAYKVKPEIVLHNKVLPEEYEELDYISNTVAVYNVEEISSSNMNAEITDTQLIKAYFETSNSQLGIETKKIKFVYVDAEGGWISTYAIDENDDEYLLGDRCCSTGSISQFGVSLTYSVIQVNDYFTVEKNGNDGGQYIDTDVNIKADVYGEYDEEASQQVDNVNVTVNTTSSFASGYRTYTYVDFCAFNDGHSNVFAIWPDGEARPSSIGSAVYLRDTLGIDVIGDIVWGTSPTAKDGTVIRILSVKDYDTFAIKTAAKLDGDIVDGVVFGSNSMTGNFGIGLKTTIGGASFTNLAFGSEVTYIPVPKVFVDINAETTVTNYKLIAGENSTSDTGTTAKFYTPNTITLFANNNENGITCSALPTSIKRTTVWKNGEIVFDGVPCREIATGTVGMFDLVDEEFLYSPTETSFVAGNVIEYPYVSTDVINITGDEHIDVVKGLDNDEYVQLDYLESDGTCAIDLGIIPNYLSVFEMKIKNEHIPNSPEMVRAVYGYWASDPTSQTGCGLRTTGYSTSFLFDLCWISGPTSAHTDSFIGGDTYWHTFKIGRIGSQGEVYVDGTRAYTYTASTASGGRSIGLFGAFTGMGLVTNYTLKPSFIGKIAYFREYRRNNNYEDIIIHDFVPVKRKSDGVLGFYDKITGSFCTNEGTGTFTAGEEYGVKANYVPDVNDSRTLMRNKLQNNTIDSGSVNPANLSNTKWATVYGNENTIIGSEVSVFGAKNTTNGDRSTVLGTSNNQGAGPYSTIVGSNNTTQAGNGTVVGYGNTLTGQNSTVIGIARAIANTNKVARETTVVGAQTYNYNTSYSVIIGSNAGVRTSGHDCATIIGYSSKGFSFSVAVGYIAQTNSQESIVIGQRGTIGDNSTYSIAIGSGARVGVDIAAPSSIAIGYNALVQAQDAILLGQGSNTEPHSFYVGFANGAVKLLDSTYVIPYGRFTTSSPTDGYCLKYDEDSDSLVWGEAGSTYELPTATTSRLGGVKVGSGLSVANDGTLSANVQSLNFEDIGGDPHDNQALSDALTGLQNNIDTVQDNLDNVESDLQAQIDNMSSIGEFLAIWDCDTGVARYLNTGFVYPTGGYFIIGAVAAQGQPNYMPDGTTYTGPSTTTTTEDVKVSDMWFYDGTHWIYLANHERQIAVDADLSTTSINPVQNRTITAALEDKQDTLQAGKGITITDNVISTSGDSVGVPQIANVYSKQLNTAEQATGRMNEESRLGFYSDICFNLNLTKDQIFDKMDELYIGIERFKRNRVTSGNSDPEDPESEEINYRNIPNFKLQNDKFVHLDQKMFCYRYETGEYGSDDPRNYIVFYTDAEYGSYQDMMDENPVIWCFYGQWIGGNQASCLNTLRSMGRFQDWEDGEWERYADGDLEVFVNIKKADSISRSYIKQRKCRSYIIDGVKKYFWCEDWSNPENEVYTTIDGKIPDSYVNTIHWEYAFVDDYAGMEYVQRSDLDYWKYNFDEFDVSEWIQSVLEPATLLDKEWGDDSQHTPWMCYWLDYPLQPVLLQDCEVKFEGGWTRLKDISDNDKETLPDNLTFRYPYNTAELWLRFSAWQKRCMYNEFKEETKEYLQLTQKQALAFAWEWDQGDSVTGKRAFGRQRSSYSTNGENTKICEYIHFNLYTPYNVYGGTKSKSTPVKKRLVINNVNGSSTIRD